MRAITARLRALVLPSDVGRIERSLRLLAVTLFVLLGIRVAWEAYRASYDFDGFHFAASHVLAEGRISSAHAVERYLPHFQILHLPFALVPVTLAGLIWYVLSVAAVLATPRELERLSGIAPAAQWPAWFAAAPFVLDNLTLGQSGPVLLWASLHAVNRTRAGALSLGGAVAGAAMLFKVPAVALLAPLLLLGRPIRALAGVAVVIVIVSGLGVACVGLEDARQSMTRWGETVSTEHTPQGMIEHDRSLRYNNQSLPITLARTFGDVVDVRPKRAVRVASLPLPIIWTASAALVAALAVAGLACVVRARRAGRDRESWLVVTSLAALGMLFVSPLVWTHYFIWALPALVALRARPATLVGVGLVSALALAFPPLRALGFHLFAAMALYGAVVVRFLCAGCASPLRPALVTGVRCDTDA